MNKNTLEQLAKKVDHARELQCEITHIDKMLAYLDGGRGDIEISIPTWTYYVTLNPCNDDLSPLVEILNEKRKKDEEEIESL